ncbi:MAG: EthD family reductase [Acidimicrobiales bacterium]
MISMHILYPKTDDSTFDMEYYCSTHMPMLADFLGDACTGWGASKPKAGPWEAIGWCNVTSQEALDAVLGEHGAAIAGDLPNYTNVAGQLVLGDIIR